MLIDENTTNPKIVENLIALSTLLPFIKLRSPLDQALFNKLFENILEYNKVTILHSKNAVFILSDFPYYWNSKNGHVYMPLDKNNMILFSKHSKSCRNETKLIYIKDYEIDLYNSKIIYAANRFLYSSKKFTDKEKEDIAKILSFKMNTFYKNLCIS